jgi:hypothetical protein
VAQGVLKAELPLLVERLQLYERQKLELEQQMKAVLAGLPEAAALCTIPGVALVVNQLSGGWLDICGAVIVEEVAGPWSPSRSS